MSIKVNVRRTFNRLATLVLTKMGYLRDQPHFVVSRKRVEKARHASFSKDEFQSILAGSVANALNSGSLDTITYHCFTTRWAKPSQAMYWWSVMPTYGRKFFSNLKHEIMIHIPDGPKPLDHPAFDDTCISIDGENILDWLRESTRGNTHICVTCQVRENLCYSTSVSIEFSNHHDAVAFKMVFG